MTHVHITSLNTANYHHATFTLTTRILNSMNIVSIRKRHFFRRAAAQN